MPEHKMRHSMELFAREVYPAIRDLGELERSDGADDLVADGGWRGDELTHGRVEQLGLFDEGEMACVWKIQELRVGEVLGEVFAGRGWRKPVLLADDDQCGLADAW